MNKQKSVSLCIIVKNEESTLKRCLNSVTEIVNEIIVVDTGSTDSTKEIAKSYNAKLIDFEWNDNFSDARNLSLQKATCDWILILDADEEFNKADYDKFISFINTTNLDGCHFTVYNYIGSKAYNDYLMHNALRLIKNNNKYEYSGLIHEQLVSKDGSSIDSCFSSEDIIIYHYGYLDDVVASKEKRARNIPLLLKQLEEKPDNAFHQFNLANEYLAQNKTEDALNLYLIAYKTADKSQSFTPHLYFRMISCYYDLQNFGEAIKIADEALKIYPKCTDILFYKGLIYYRKNLHFLAVECFEQCVKMGEPPSELKFINSCCSFRPLACLGEIYFVNQNYLKAVECYTKALNSDNKNISLMYKIGEAINKSCCDKESVFTAISNFFSDTYLPNAIIIADILIQLELYNQAKQIIDNQVFDIKYRFDILFIKSKIDFYLNNYDKAFKNFNDIIKNDFSNSLLPNIKHESLKFLFIINTKKSFCTLDDIFKICNKETTLYKVYQSIEKAIEQNKAIGFDSKLSNKDIIPIVFDYLEKVLRLKEYDLFEKSLYILNSIDSEYILLLLAKLYYKYGYKKLAHDTIINSIKTFNTIDSEAANILGKLI